MSHPANTFKLSENLRTDLVVLRGLLPEDVQNKFMEAIGGLCAEVEIHCRREFASVLRKEWSDALETMYLIPPRQPK